MGKVKFHWDCANSLDVDTDKDVDVYIDSFVESPIPEGNIRIILLIEALNFPVFNLVINNPNLYTYVLTSQESILKNNSKAYLWIYGTSWVSEYIPLEKKFRVSTVVGGKVDKNAPGYEIRRELWRNKESITIPKDFYLSSQYKWKEMSYTENLVLGDTKYKLFDSMFHITIENIQQNNTFTEKIVDCFQTRTVPIYMGCPNIGEFFNIEGILTFSNVNQAIDICNGLTTKVYDRMLPAMEDNYNRSWKWVNLIGRMEDAVRKLIN